MSSTATRSFNNTSGLYCPACEEPYAPAPPHHPPVLLSPCGHSLCAACFAALPSPAWCLVCDVAVTSHASNTFLAELAAEMLCGSGGGEEENAVRIGSEVVSAECASVVAEHGVGNGAVAVEPSLKDVDGAFANLGARDGIKKRPCPTDDVGVASKKPSPLACSCTVHPDPSQLTKFCMMHKEQCCEHSHAGPGCSRLDMSVAAALLRQRAAAHASKCAAAASSKYPAAIGRVQAALGSLKEQHVACRERVNASVQEIIAGVEAHRVRVLGQIDALYSERLKSLEVTLDRLIVSVGQLEACVALEAKHTSATVAAESTIAQLCVLESLCGGMSSLVDAYVGVDVPPCMGVSVDVAGVLAAVEQSTQLMPHVVSSKKCTLTGPGISGFKYGHSDDARANNTFTIACVDEDGVALECLCAEDVRVSGCCVARAKGSASSGPMCDGRNLGACYVNPTKALGGGVFEVCYVVPTSPGVRRSRLVLGELELEVCVTVCGVVVGGCDSRGYVSKLAFEFRKPVYVREFSVYMVHHAREVIASVCDLVKGMARLQHGDFDCDYNEDDDYKPKPSLPAAVLKELCDTVSACVAANADIAVSACSALQDACKCNAENIPAILDAECVTHIVFPAMDAHVTSKAVQHSACGALHVMWKDLDNVSEDGGCGHEDARGMTLYDRMMAMMHTGGGGVDQVKRAVAHVGSFSEARRVLEFCKVPY